MDEDLLLSCLFAQGLRLFWLGQTWFPDPSELCHSNTLHRIQAVKNSVGGFRSSIRFVSTGVERWVMGYWMADGTSRTQGTAGSLSEGLTAQDLGK